MGFGKRSVTQQQRPASTQSAEESVLRAPRNASPAGGSAGAVLMAVIVVAGIGLGVAAALWQSGALRFTLGNILLGLLMLTYAYLITRLFFPSALAEQATAHAEQAQESEGMETEALPGSISDKLLSRRGWQQIARAFVMEWRMVWKELLFGFTIAGFISVLVPQSFWNAIFLLGGGGSGQTPGFLAVLENALVAPFVAFFTFIGSMGNVPLAAMLWSKGVSFGGVMSFLGADLVAATVVWIQIKYYGWRYALYLSALLYVCMVLAGVSVHYLFAAAGQIPNARPDLAEMVRFSVDYTLFLNLAFGAVASILIWLWKSGQRGEQADASHREAQTQGRSS